MVWRRRARCVWGVGVGVGVVVGVGVYVGHSVSCNLCLASGSVRSVTPCHHSPNLPCTHAIHPKAAQKQYDEATGGRPERLVSGSDDFTMFLWQPSTSKSHLARMTGHVQLINQVGCFWVQLLLLRAG